MNPVWFVRPDWPMDYEIMLRNALMSAIQCLPNGDVLDDQDVEGKAMSLFSSSEWGWNEEQPHNRPSSARKNDDDLIKLMSHLEKTRTHINQMNRPAVGAFFSEGGDLWALKTKIGESLEIARHALGQTPEDEARGPRKIKAALVAETAGFIFERVAGQPPTYTTDPISNEISGPWPTFLSSVFAALRIDASVESQAKALREKASAN